MKVLFVHPNYPGQYRDLAPALQRLGYEVTAIGKAERGDADPRGVTVHRYKGAPFGGPRPGYPPLDTFAAASRQGRAVANLAYRLLAEGYEPDVIIGHPGWGDMLFLEQVWPKARQIAYCEFYYQLDGPDAVFDPEFRNRSADRDYVRLRNLNQLLAHEQAEICVSPTPWQRSLFPPKLRRDIEVAHEGVDTARIAPNPHVRLLLPNGDQVDRRRPILTYSARNLEPYRGFHSFMRALPEIQRRIPDLLTIIVGGTEVSYGRRPPDGGSWKDVMLDEVGGQLDASRIWWAGKLPFAQYLSVLQLSTVHFYLTYPFVLSWSLVEAMSAGCTLVASDVPPVREVIEDGRNGRLVDFFDYDAIADAACELMRDEATRHRLGASARATAIERFDLTTVTLPRYRALIDSLAPPQGGTEPDQETLAG